MSESVVLAIIERDKKILLVRERDKTHFKLPGGHVSNSENDYQALTRELKEELDVTLKRADYLHSDKCDSHNLKYYNVQIVGEPSPKGEVEEILWVEHEIAKKNNYFLTADIAADKKQSI